MMKHSRRNKPGRQAASPQLVLDAAEQVGSDGKGRDGLPGYLTSLAKNHPVQFCALLAKVMELEPAEEPPKEVFRTQEEVEAEMKRRGLPIPKGMF